ncbi:MAG TPA: GntR family transcriptional regulator [Xanthobacteraceae bacterium]|uniref:GntR family transcriptional regulator n=1 Tax=Roseixanthobacter finlandensis TaxID=3119922 RepID=UPI000BCFC2F8|nr:MAG: GntR family transcriptional regulator [Rhizobiales bacterium 39-66-18]HQS07682.1 GntR family transcriptional regulator [Xanthobacteraceae bacterium]HQS46511.1 GntR family transcriptional regulator [Xanthobacteraceae bacterium]
METRYAYVARALAEAISSGRHPVGSFLPNEFELADQFSVSRSTVRAAMRELEASGLVSRRKSAGTRVEAAVPVSRSGGFVQTLATVEAVQQFGVETERHTQDVADVVADAELAQKLGCKPGQRWLRISSLRIVPGDVLPICWTDVYIDGAFSAEVRAKMAGHAGIYSTLVEEISGRRMREIRQDIKAGGIPERVAGPLKAQAGAHALEIRRQYILSPQDMVEISISVHPADRYSYSTRLTRQEAGPA